MIKLFPFAYIIRIELLFLFVFTLYLSKGTAQSEIHSKELIHIDELINQDLNKALSYTISLLKSPPKIIYPGYLEELMFKQSQIYSALGKFELADSLLNVIGNLKINEIFSELNPQLYIVKAEALYKLGNYSDAILQVNEALKLNGESNHGGGLYDVNRQYAKIYSSLGNKIKALNFIESALNERNLNNKQLCSLLFDKVGLLIHTEDVKELYSILMNLNSLRSRDSDFSCSGKLHLAWADYYVMTNNYDQAQIALNQSDELFKLKDDKRNLYKTYIEKARIFSIKQNDYAQKLFLRKAISEAENLGDLYLIYNGKLKIANLFYNQNENDSAYSHVNSIINHSPFVEQKISAYDLLKAIYVDQNKFKEGLFAIEKRLSLSDSLKNFVVNDELLNSQLEYDNSIYENKKSELEILIDEQLFNYNKRLSILNFIAIGVLILLIFSFIGFLIVKLNINKKDSLFSDKLLYLQLDSHFVFNSLTAIQSLILKNKVVNADHYLQLFSDLTLHILKFATQKTIPLHEELSFQMAYLQMQKLRFGEDLKYKIELSEDVDPQQYNVPPFMIYPFLEHAIESCIQKKGAKGTIKMSIRKENAYLLMELEDNDIGFLKFKEAFLDRPGQNRIYLYELITERFKELNFWYLKKKYSIHFLQNQVDGNHHSSILQFKMRIK